METPQKANLLRRLPFLHSLDDASLLKIAERLTSASFPPQDPVFVEGDAADCLWIVEQGKIDLVRRDGEERTSFGQLTAGDMLGDTDVLHGGTFGYSAIAAEPTRLLAWRRDLLLGLLEEHPQVRRELEFMIAGRTLAQQLRLPWLAEGEAVYAAARRHAAVLWRAWLLALLFLLPGAALLALGWAGGALGLAPGIALLSAGAAIALYQWFDWRNDYYLVTSRRAVWVEKIVLLYDSRLEAPLFNVLAVNLRTTLLGRLLGYGDVIVRTYTGQVTFREVPQPLVMGALIQEHWSRQRTSRQAADRDALTRSVQDVMTPSPAAPSASPRPPTAPSVSGQGGLNRWDLRVRFEEDGIITYRKHWGVLLRSTRWPSTGLALSLLFLALAWTGAFPVLRLATSKVLGISALVITGAWWLYQFADWANDLYQVTSTQIIDIRKRPLGDEQRKVAPLENILGTEVERRGLIQLILNFGNVVANVGTSQFVFEGVFDPSGVQQDIVRAQEAFLQRLRETEAGQRRDEMVELLHLYHERSASRPATAPDERDS